MYKKKSNNWPLKIAVCAMLIAMSIVLTRFLPIYIGNDKRIAFGDIPIMLAGIWFGPFIGGAVGLVSDIAGSFVSGLGWYPPLTIPALLVGVIAGLLKRVFLKGGIKFFKVGSMLLIGNIITSMLVTTYLLSGLYGTDFLVLLLPRCIISVLITVVETICITVVLRTLGTSPAFIEGKRKVYMTKEQALKYIHSVSWMGSRPGLSRTKDLLKRLGNPQNSLKFVHVAGTNGKGSVSVMLYNILLKAGIKAGMYTSPYIEVFNERIQALGEMISDDELAYVTQIVKAQADKMKEKPTEFELITCIAFEYFKRKGADLVVLEVGLGGELDSTNVINVPEVAVITAMSYDHTQVLGDSMADIAKAKAGIIKQGCDVVSYGNEPEAEKVFREAAIKLGANIVHPDFLRIVNESVTIDGRKFSYKQYTDMSMSLIGDYQLYNAAVVIETAEILMRKGYAVDEQAIKEGIMEAKWPARFEVIAKEPIVIVDGAHNPDGMYETSKSIRNIFDGKKIIFVIGVMADKDVSSMLPHILPLAEIFFTVTPDNPRAMSAEELASQIKKLGVEAASCNDMDMAAKAAIERAGKNGVICALGSLYMASDIKNAFRKMISK